MYCDLGGHSCGDAQQLLVGRGKDVVGVASCSSDVVVAGWGDVDDCAQGLRVAHGGNAAPWLLQPAEGRIGLADVEPGC